MKIIAVDDEKIALEGLMDIIGEIVPEADLHGFRNGKDALEYVEAKECQIAFLDIQMRDMDGIMLAKKLKLLNPKINIIFTTGFAEYAGEAFKIHASGYITKPVTREKIQQEIEELRHPVLRENNKKLRVQAFGNFEVFMEEKPLKFKYSKTKEMFAYIIDRKGAMCTNGELIGILWEDEEQSTRHSSYLKNLRADLLSTLRKYKMEHVIVRQRGNIGVVPEEIQCDYYEWLKGTAYGINAYRGEYMQQYSWSELTHGKMSEGQTDEI